MIIWLAFNRCVPQLTPGPSSIARCLDNLPWLSVVVCSDWKPLGVCISVA